ncbi:MAG: hypothetical protein LBF21_00840 [Puniceicoccales bacterium]|nr:hypothetical protein [Puniceicoccales bacterium]
MYRNFRLLSALRNLKPPAALQNFRLLSALLAGLILGHPSPEAAARPHKSPPQPPAPGSAPVFSCSEHSHFRRSRPNSQHSQPQQTSSSLAFRKYARRYAPFDPSGARPAPAQFRGHTANPPSSALPKSLNLQRLNRPFSRPGQRSGQSIPTLSAGISP